MVIKPESKENPSNLASANNLQSLVEAILAEASCRRGDSLSLLALLRTLESLHREIRDTLFQQSLPDNRQALYSLLKDVEAEGGWPYIHRMRLRSLLVNFLQESEEGNQPISPNSNGEGTGNSGGSRLEGN